MDHLTTREILEFVDGTIPDGLRTKVEEHLEHCPRCRRELTVHRAIGSAVQGTAFLTTSHRFTAGVMQRVLPAGKPSWVQKILNNLGGLLAMMFVLGALAISFSSPELWTTSERASPMAEVVKMYSDFYEQAKTAVSAQTTKLFGERAHPSASSGQGEKLAVMVIGALALLAALDKFVLQRAARLRM